MPKPKAPTVDDVIATIRAYVRLQGWTRQDLARAAGMHDTTLRDFWLPTWAPGTPTLRILSALIPKGFDPATVPPESELPPKIDEKRAAAARSARYDKAHHLKPRGTRHGAT